MSLVGVFTKFRPEIGGIFFDATLDETSTLMTIVSSYPLEDASTANDNAVTKPLELTMTVAISDNPIKAMTAGEDNLSGLTSMGVSLVGGTALSMLSGGAAALGGLAATAGMTYANSGQSRSESALLSLRNLQRNKTLLKIVGVGSSYDNMLITKTQVKKVKGGEGAQEIIVEMQQITIVTRDDSAITTNSNLPKNDPVATQGQKSVNLGQVPVK